MPSTVALISSIGVSMFASSALIQASRSHSRKSPGGGPPRREFRDLTRQMILDGVTRNMITPIELIRATVDAMAGRGFGRIVNITSAAVKAPIDVLGLSNGARSGLTGFVAGVARSGIAAKGVTINGLLPGAFDTDRLRSGLQHRAKATGQDLDTVAKGRAKPCHRRSP